MLKLNSDLQDEKDKMLVQNTKVNTKLIPVMMLLDQQKYFYYNNSLLFVTFILRQSKKVR